MLTILFSDIANFTAISEGIDSDELANLMNHYFERSVSECIHRTDGTVVKYIGDAIFAFWNAPEQQSDHALRACEAALHCRGQGVTLVHGQPLYTRIGLHTGVANVGNFGSSTRMDYTAIGENINLASRMEGLNKHLGTQTLITGETKNEIGDRLVTRPLGRFQLKGFEKNVEVFELLGRLESAEGSQPLRAAFALALRLFQEKKFDEAEAAFGKVLEIEPNDGPAKFYLKQTAGWREQAPPEDWSGEVELKEK
jgi:adenylate cyclase